MLEVEGGIRRVTFALPLGIDHVHCYFLPASDGGWNLVDTGLGVPDAEETWRGVLEELDAPVARIVVTHFHPDHVGAAADVAGLTGAPVYQGVDDYDQCVRTWGAGRNEERMPEYLEEHGVPPEEVQAFREDAAGFVRFVRFAPDPEPLRPGDAVDGWEVLHLPGHADGHIALLRDGVLIAGDTLLASITPNVGLYPDSRPNPLDDYLNSLATIVALEPRLALPGHHEPIEDPAARALELTAHHAERLEQTVDALDSRPQTAWEVSFALFPEPLSSTLRRFALAETRAHLEYLVRGDEAARSDGGGRVMYTALG